MKDSIWNQVLTYFYIRNRNTNNPKNINIKMMHGMNRISLFMFLVAIVVIIIRAIRHH